MDLKPENMCVKYDKLTGEIVSIGLLDVDPDFSITSDVEGFSKHAKVFMNFLFFSVCLKYEGIKFPNWYLTKDDVRQMTEFFFHNTSIGLKKAFKPIDVLCHYLLKSNKKCSESISSITFEKFPNDSCLPQIL